MKVLILNGSPSPNGNTAIALKEMENVVAAEGIEYETIVVAIRILEAVLPVEIQRRVMLNGMLVSTF